MQPDRGIGFNGALLHRNKEDLSGFRRVTRGHVVLMGRKTYEEIGRPLPDRINVVLSRSKSADEFPGVDYVSSDVDDALDWCERNHKDKITYVCGGEQIYVATMHRTVRVVMTIHIGVEQKPSDAKYPVLPNRIVLTGRRYNADGTLEYQDYVDIDRVYLNT